MVFTTINSAQQMLHDFRTRPLELITFIVTRASQCVISTSAHRRTGDSALTHHPVQVHVQRLSTPWGPALIDGVRECVVRWPSSDTSHSFEWCDAEHAQCVAHRLTCAVEKQQPCLMITKNNSAAIIINVLVLLHCTSANSVVIVRNCPTPA